MAKAKMPASKNKYTMRISRLTVDKLGVKLYDRVSAVLAELIANSYDADAEHVVVEAPMGELLAEKKAGVLKDRGFSIVVEDDGCGMTPEQVNEFYLVVGKERRNDPKRGDKSAKHKRAVMGRKGVGKLAPFGVCRQIEIITSGGGKIDGEDEHGKPAKGYLTAHLILDRKGIVKDTDDDYSPKVGALDGTVRAKHGTRLVMTDFDHRHVPEMETLTRQLAQRFGVRTANWKITLRDTQKTKGTKGHENSVGEFGVQCQSGTKITLKDRGASKGDEQWAALDEDSHVVANLFAGFEYEGAWKAVTGWVAYAEEPYKDELMAGVRVYCRGKIAAQTAVFNRKAGFTGEYDVRSYLVGELNADWLDEHEDLIRTDRQDILWSHGPGVEFEKWGQNLVSTIGKLTREPVRKKAWDKFAASSDLENVVTKAFPADAQKDIRENTMQIAKAIAKTVRQDELDDKTQVQNLVDLSLMLGPHITLDRKLQEVTDNADRPLSAITGLLRTARVAELSSFGSIAENRVRVIDKLESLIAGAARDEAALQELIDQAPWLINPQWSPITSNQSFATLRLEFAKHYKKMTGNDIVLQPSSKQNKRADFVLTNQDTCIHLIEIKAADHALKDEEMARINTYDQLMTEFLGLAGNEEFKRHFPEFRITLVCDKLGLKGLAKAAFDGLKSQGRLDHVTWGVFMKRARLAHQDFLKEAERQRKLASKGWVDE
ncbi:MAG: ATP-binding protein [Phycisphaerales bacterium]|nr:ATP-binding protein [Phycisphaerales bacterium]